jgi:serine/threonine-protein kinase RsbW
MGNERVIQILIPSQLGYEKIVIAAITVLAQKMNFSLERTDDLKTALGEAVINAIEHGNQGNQQLAVGVTAYVREEALVLNVADQGKQPLPQLPVVRQERADHRGWGLFLIQNLVDEVKAMTGPGRNELTMRLNRA